MLHYGLEWHSLDSYFQFREISTPGTPESNEIRLYAKDSSGTSTLCYKNDAGTEICLPTSGSFVTGTGVADRVAIWTSTSVIGSDAGLTFAPSTDILTVTGGIVSSDLTSGSVLFAGTSGRISQSNANFFWDNSNARLGIKTSAPSSLLHVLATTTLGIDGIRLSGATSLDLSTIINNSAGDVRSFVAGGVDSFIPGTVAGDAGIRWNSAKSLFLGISSAARFVIGTAGQWGIGGATFGSSGDIFSSGGASAAPTWVTRATLNAALDHGTLSGLGDDDHTQYALLAGRSGGQTLIGGTASGNNLILKSTTHATKGALHILDAYEILWGLDTNPISTVNQRGLTLTQVRDPGNTGTAHAVEGQFFGYSNSTTQLVAGFRFCVSDGTNASPAATLLNTGAFLGLIGHDGSAYVAGSKALITMKAAATWTSTSNGTYITFETTPIGSTSRTEQWRIDSTGDLVAKLATQKIDLTTISAGNPNFKITATSDTPTVTWTALGTLPPSTAPAGYIEILVGSDTRYIPFWA